MSGKQQHFIPQFLQKGFSSRSSKKEDYVWVYRKGIAPFNPNTKGIGQERYFYSDSDDAYIDNAITAEEDLFATFCEQMRTDPNAIQDLDRQAPRLLAHLEVRSKNFRDSFISNSQVMFDAIFELITDQEKVQKFIENKMTDDPLHFFDKNIPKQGMRKFQRLTIAKKMRLAFLRSGKLPEGANTMVNFFSTKRDEIPELIKAAIISGQLKTLRRSVVPQKRVDLFSSLSYEIVSTPNLHLGDSMLVLLVENNRDMVFKTVISKKEKCVVAFLPLSVNTALVGKLEDTPIDIDNFVNQIAPCSVDFFIADRNEKNLEMKAGQIGENNNLLSKSELEGVVASILSNQDFL